MVSEAGERIFSRLGKARNFPPVSGCSMPSMSLSAKAGQVGRQGNLSLNLFANPRAGFVSRPLATRGPPAVIRWGCRAGIWRCERHGAPGDDPADRWALAADHGNRGPWPPVRPRSEEPPENRKQPAQSAERRFSRSRAWPFGCGKSLLAWCHDDCLPAMQGPRTAQPLALVDKVVDPFLEPGYSVRWDREPFDF